MKKIKTEYEFGYTYMENDVEKTGHVILIFNDADKNYSILPKSQQEFSFKTSNKQNVNSNKWRKTLSAIEDAIHYAEMLIADENIGIKLAREYYNGFDDGLKNEKSTSSAVLHCCNCGTTIRSTDPRTCYAGEPHRSYCVACAPLPPLYKTTDEKIGTKDE